MWIASWINFDCALGGARAMRDQIVGAVEIEPADLTDPRRNQQVGRVAGEPGTGDAVLHDVEGVDHDGGDARPSGAAEELALHGAFGRKKLAEAALRRRGFDHNLRRIPTVTSTAAPCE